MMTRTYSLIHLVSFTLSLSFPLYAYAQTNSPSNLLQLSLKELTSIQVYAVSKKNEPINQAPSVVTVVTSKQIQQYGGRTLADVIARQPSMFMFGSSFLDNMATSMRGGKLTHTDNWILLLLNGRPIRESHNGGLNSDIYSMFPVEMIDKIEIIRGPGSVIYGTNAFTGVINIITKNSDDLPPSIAVTYGSFKTKQATFLTSHEEGELNLTSALRYLDSRGWEFEATDELGAHDSQDRKIEGLQWVLQADYKDFTLNTIIGNLDQMTIGFFDWSSASGSAFPPGTIQRRYIDAGYHPTLSDDWDLSINYTFNGHSMRDRNAKRASEGSLLEATLRHYYSDNLDILTGAVVDQIKGDLDSQADGGDYELMRYSLYAQIDYQFTDQLDIILGGQWNKQEGLSSNLSPRLGIITTITDNWGIKLLYGEAYREAFAFQSFFNVPSFKGNPNLTPEQIATYEIQALYNDNKLSAGLTYFYSTISDSHFRPTVAGITTVENSTDDIISKGVEFEFNSKITDWYELQGSILYQENKSDNNKKDVLFAPNLMAKIGITLSPGEQYQFSLFDSYFSEAGKLEEIESGVSVVNPPADPYHLLTAKIEWKPLTIKNLSISLYGDNLLDDDIHFPDLNRRAVNTIPQHSGRALYLTAEYTF
jgi:outer membrane receptor for ferrienterochelin and colicin